MTSAKNPSVIEPVAEESQESKPVVEPAVVALSPIPLPGVAEVAEDNPFSSSGAFALGQRKARALAESTMVPEQYRGNIPNCLIALELSSRIGVSVFAVMQNIDIIHGRPGWRATFLIATVNASGRFTPLRFRWEGEKGTASYGCRAVANDRESGEELIGTVITWAMVHAEGWADKKGSKWKTMPEQMFCYRAAAFWARLYAPELSLGMHTADEQADLGPVIIESQRTVTQAPRQFGHPLSRERPAPAPAARTASKPDANQDAETSHEREDGDDPDETADDVDSVLFGEDDQ